MRQRLPPAAWGQPDGEVMEGGWRGVGPGPQGRGWARCPSGLQGWARSFPTSCKGRWDPGQGCKGAKSMLAGIFQRQTSFALKNCSSFSLKAYG